MLARAEKLAARDQKICRIDRAVYRHPPTTLTNFFWSYLCAEKGGHSGPSRAEDHNPDVDRPNPDGRAIRSTGPSDVVGVQLGHYGARYLFRDVRHFHSVLRLLRPHETGLFIVLITMTVNDVNELQEYVLPDVRDREFLLHFHKKAKRVGMDIDEYNRLKQGIAEIENDLRRLRDPLRIHRPERYGDRPDETSNQRIIMAASLWDRANVRLQSMFRSTRQ